MTLLDRFVVGLKSIQLKSIISYNQYQNDLDSWKMMKMLTMLLTLKHTRNATILSNQVDLDICEIGLESEIRTSEEVD